MGEEKREDLLPEGWKVVKLGEVAELKQGKTPRREQYDDKSGYRIIKVKDFEDGGKVSITPKGDRSFVRANLGEVNKVKGGDILILNSGHSSEVVGQKVGIVPKELEGAFYVAELTRIKAIEKKADNYFLFALLMLDNIRDFIRGLVKGGHLYVSHLKSLPVPLPPLPEQKAIAYVLRTVQEAKEATEKVISSLRELKKSLMKHLFTYGPVPVEGIDKVELKDREIGKIPAHWKVVRLGEVAKCMKAGGTPKRSEPNFWGGDIPFVLIEDLTSCGLYLDTTKETITEEGLKNSSAWLVPPRSLLLSMYATIGETAVNTIPVATNQAILAIIPKDNFYAEFGAYLLKFHSSRLARYNVQSTQRNVNKGIVEKFSIPLPPLEEQKQIAHILQTVDQKIEAEKKQKQALENLFKSFLHNLMTAKVRLPREFVRRFEEVNKP